MLITLKPPHEDAFTVEIDRSQTIGFFKEKIEKLKGDTFPAKKMKLIHAGKYLLNHKNVGDYDLHEKKFVILTCKELESSFVEEFESESNMAPERRVAMRIMRNSPGLNHSIGPEFEALIRQVIGPLGDEVEVLSENFPNPNGVDFDLGSPASSTSDLFLPTEDESSEMDDSDTETEEDDSSETQCDFAELMSAIFDVASDSFEEDMQTYEPSSDSQVLSSDESLFSPETESCDVLPQSFDGMDCGDETRRGDTLESDSDSNRVEEPVALGSPGACQLSYRTCELSCIVNNEFFFLRATVATRRASLDQEPLHFPTHQSYGEMDDCDNETRDGSAFESSSSRNAPVATVAASQASPGAEPIHFPSRQYYDEMDDCDETRRADTFESDFISNESSDGMEETEVYERSDEESQTSHDGSKCSTCGQPYYQSSVPNHADDNESLESSDELENCDHDAIHRLTQLGFSDPTAVEAYFTCGKNESAAAEYLLTKKC